MGNDLISRKALLEELQEAYDNAHRILQNQYNPETQEFCKLQLRTLRSVIKDVKEAPTIDAEPVKHGQWCETKLPGIIACSACGLERHKSLNLGAVWRYCPKCGARLDGGKNDF